MKKKIIALLSFVLIVVGMCCIHMEGSYAHAVVNSEIYTENDDFVSEYHTEIKTYRATEFSEPEAPEGYENYLFAGWYSDKNCKKEQALPSSTNEGAAWAKFVPEGVLSVKSQIAKTSTGSYNMRIVSSLDTLNYGAVGFKVEYNNNGKIIDVPIKDVFTRIKATAESGVQYNFSPKVIDTKSEYFMTATLLNINSQKSGNEFRIVPYWKTLDGTMVYGVNRYITVNDGIFNRDDIVTNDVFSFNVKQDALDWSQLAVTDVEDSNVDYRHKNGDDYVSVIVSGQNESKLQSATKFVITGAEDESISVVHRNYNTTHETTTSTANADSSWYKIYNEVYPEKKEYVIATSADLYGLAAKVNKKIDGAMYSFDGDTIYVVADITVNDGTASSSGFSMSDSTKTKYMWTSIGSINNKFKGVFDGQMHVIKGICQETSDQYAGFFGWVRDNAEIKNFSLKNSYFQSSAAIIGSVVGQLGGTVDTVYSDAHIVTSKVQAGGIVGRAQQATASITTANKVENCCFAGSVTMTGVTKECYVGGILGTVVEDKAIVSNCFNEGTVLWQNDTTPSTKTLFIGALCGGVMNSGVELEMKDCLNVGEVKAQLTDGTKDSTVKVANIIGGSIGITKIDNVVVINDFTANLGFEVADSSGNSGDIIWNNEYWIGEKESIIGCNSYNRVVKNNTDKLNYYTSANPDGKWIIRDDDVPALKSFVNNGIDVAWYYNNIDDDTYTISTEEEFYGLSALSETTTFEGKTINLNADLKLNSGKSSEWIEGTKDADREWPMIGRSNAKAFNGIFNGNGHTIQGVYMNINLPNMAAAGLFGETNHQAIIKNFKLTNSAFVTTGNPTTYLGSIVGRGDGTLVNIYCDDSVIIDTKNTTTVGGVIGTIANGTTNTKTTTKCTIVNCGFSGVINQNVTGVTSHVNTGGIVGLHAYGNGTNGNKLIIDNCLYNGTVDVSAAFSEKKNIRAGGIVGAKNGLSDAVFDMSNCLSDGTIKISRTSDTGGIVSGALFGGVGSQSDGGENYHNVYATTDCYTKALGIYPKGKSASDHEAMTITYVNAMNLYGNKAETLDYTYVWEALDNDTPKLQYYYNETSTNYDWYVESVGDAADPYLIRTAGELDVVASMTNSGHSFVGETIKLEHDIVYNKGTANFDTVAEWEKAQSTLKKWTPIGTAVNDTSKGNAFEGTFDGNQNTISGLYINGESRVGLFGVTASNATIKNLAVTNSYITASGTSIGSIIGKGGATLQNVYSDTLINSTGTQIGGMIGRGQVTNATNTSINMTGCWFGGTIIINNGARLHTGGMLGYEVKGSVNIDNCIFSGEIRCTSTVASQSDLYGLRVGGFVGASNGSDDVNSLSIRNSMSAGTVTADSTTGNKFTQIGSVIGNIGSNLTPELSNVYATKECYKTVCGHSSSLGKLAISIEEESAYGATPCSFLGFDFTNTWVTRKGQVPGLKSFVDSNCTSTLVADRTWANVDGAGTTENPYIIADAADLLGLSMLSLEGKTFEGKTIKIQLPEGVTEIDLNPDWTAGSGEVPDIFWNPVGNETNPFKGTFDGNGHTIKGIYNKSNQTTNVGLFGYVDVGATVQNFYLENSEFNQDTGSNASVGSVAAELHGTANTVYSKAIINSNSQFSGGLFACVDGGESEELTDNTTHTRGTVKINDAWFEGALNVDCNKVRYIGGIAAKVEQGTVEMKNILFTGTIDVVEYTNTSYAGGIIGATVPQTIVTADKTYGTDDYTTIKLDSCISAGRVNQTNSQPSSVIGRVESAVILIEKDGEQTYVPANSYLRLKNVFATSECNSYAYRERNAAHKDTDVTAEGIVTNYDNTAKATVVQTQYNSDQLIGYCQEYATTVEDYKNKIEYSIGASLNFNDDWTMRTADVPVLTKLSAIVGENELENNPEGLTEELGLTYLGDKTLNQAVNSGQGNYLLNYNQIEMSTYEMFLNFLSEEKLFEGRVINNTEKKHSTMAEDGVYNSTLVKDNWVINITYVSEQKKLDVIINTFGEDALSPNLQEIPQTTNGDDVTLSMLKLTGGEQMEEYGNSFVFQLPNGHFIISDGGNSGDDEDTGKGDARQLIEYLKDLAEKDSNKDDDNVYIDAWIISHFHTDHCGVLMELYSNAKLRTNVYLEAVYVNEPNNYAKLFENNQYENASKAIGGAMKLTKVSDHTKKPNVYRMHTGERYYFDGLTMDVVLTQEQLDPHYNAEVTTGDKAYRYYGDWDGFNATSTTCVFTINNARADGTQDKIYMGGDSNKANMNYIMKAYDGLSAYLTHNKIQTDPNVYTEKVNGTITQTSSKTLSAITVFVAMHHGKNTSAGFTKYLFGNESAPNDKLDIVLFPYHQMYEAVKQDDGTYLLEDGSSVFDYRIKSINEKLCASANNVFYTYGIEDSWCIQNSGKEHGTVELTFTSTGIRTNVLAY